MRNALCGTFACLALLASAYARAATPAADAHEPETLAAEIRNGAHAGIDGFVVLRGDRMTVDAEAATLPHEGRDIRSATKTVTALLVGVAIQRGLIPSVDAPVADLLPEYAATLRADPRKAKIRVSDLLTMRSGLACDDWDPHSPGQEDRMYRRRDWLAFWAALPMRDDPGARFSYCTGNAIALGRIVEVASGQTLTAFADAALFAPLGIRDARWASWARGTRTDGGGHLRLTPMALARIGRLMLDNGRVDGRSVVDTAWIEAMTAERTAIPGLGQRYGYLCWLDATTSPDAPRVRLWMAWGNGGNFLIALPELDSVVVFAGTRYQRDDALEPLLWLRDRVLPALRAPP